MTVDLGQTEHGQLLLRAAGYLEAAEILKLEWEGKPLLRAPILQLVAHGLEVLLKHNLSRQGVSAEKLANKPYGHNIRNLWGDPQNTQFKRNILESAVRVWADMKRKNEYIFDEATNPENLFEEYTLEIANLHTGSYPLRYLSDPLQRTPVPYFIIDTLNHVAEERIREMER